MHVARRGEKKDGGVATQGQGKKKNNLRNKTIRAEEAKKKTSKQNEKTPNKEPPESKSPRCLGEVKKKSIKNCLQKGRTKSTTGVAKKSTRNGRGKVLNQRRRQIIGFLWLVELCVGSLGLGGWRKKGRDVYRQPPRKVENHFFVEGGV